MPKKTYLLIVFLMPVLLWAQEHSYTLTGKIGNLNGPSIVYLAYKKDGKNMIDSTTIKDGVFTLKGTLVDPFYATLVMDHNAKGIRNLPRGKNDMLKLYIDKGETRLSSPDSAWRSSIEGSDLNIDHRKLMAQLNAVNDNESRQPIRKAFIEENPNSFISLAALWDYAGDFSKPGELETLFYSLSENIQQTQSGRGFVKMLRNVSLVRTGMVAPEFVQADVKGRPVSLSAFRGKYVLIDFWASWCGPCRADNPHLTRIYEKYSHENFTILGVSLDKSDGRKAWLDAIKKDGLPWKQVSDLKGWDNEVAKLYGVRFIPQNYLIGPDGKIVASKLTAEQLEQLLEKIL